MEKFLIACDVDNVVADLVSVILNRYEDRFGISLSPCDIKEYDLSKFLDEGFVEECFDNPNIYDDVQPIAGSISGIAYLRSAGHRVAFVTSCSSMQLTRKLNWLQDFGFLDERVKFDPDYIPCVQKELIRADILIDDKYENVAKFQGIGDGNRAILFSQPWNLAYPWRASANAWDEVLDIIDDYGSAV
jgi:5'(3')-deoxyribonucleotidase